MSISFTSLEIGSGDAFLLQNNDWKCLFDAGGNQRTIVSKLRQKGINQLDVAICSHNDKDHANGFLGILRSGIHIEEIWLPATWAALIQYAIDNPDIFEDIIFEMYLRIDCLNDAYEKTLLMDTEKVPIDLLFNDYKHRSKYRHLRRILLQAKYYNPSKESMKLVIDFERIFKIACMALNGKTKVRWFTPKNICVKKDIDYNLRALNSVEEFRTYKLNSCQQFIDMLALSTTNEYSLIFEYLHIDIPIIRFSADSDRSCQSVNPYTKNIIITAPHHGSEDNANVYNQICGNDIIWVRSDSKNSHNRPCSAFKKLNCRYCLACSQNRTLQEIKFEYDTTNNQWKYVKGIRCIC